MYPYGQGKQVFRFGGKGKGMCLKKRQIDQLNFNTRARKFQQVKTGRYYLLLRKKKPKKLLKPSSKASFSNEWVQPALLAPDSVEKWVSNTDLTSLKSLSNNLFLTRPGTTDPITERTDSAGNCCQISASFCSLSAIRKRSCFIASLSSL